MKLAPTDPRNPFYRVVVGDCLEEMRKMPDESVDLIITSPPYNLGDRKKLKSGKIWPNAALRNGYASYSDDMPFDAYWEWIDRFLIECWRLIKKDGAIYFNHKKRSHDKVMISPISRNPTLILRDEIIWDRGGGSRTFNEAIYRPTTEYVHVYAKPDFKLREVGKERDLWFIPPECNNPHPAPFPIELPLRILKSVMRDDRDYVVCDPFSGSGTTGVACKMLGASYVGIELDPGYAKGSEERIAKTAANDLGIVVNPLATTRLLHGDCLDKLTLVSDGSIDLAVCDLPFGIQQLDIDRKIDLDAFWRQMDRVLTQRGTVVMFAAGIFAGELQMSKRDWFRHDLTWKKPTNGGFARCNVAPMTNTERVLVFSKGSADSRRTSADQMVYRPQGLTPFLGAQKKQNARVPFRNTLLTGDAPAQRWTNYPGQILEFDRVKQSERVHPSQKPVDLLRYLIRTYSDDDGLVLDPTMGSGSTGVAAWETGRGFVGIEQHRGYFISATRRIAGDPTWVEHGKALRNERGAA